MSSAANDQIEAFPDVHPIDPALRGARSTTEACAVCASSVASPVYSIAGMDFEMVVCRDCGAGRMSPLPSADDVASFYPDAYYGTRGAKFEPSVERLIRFVAVRRLRFLLGGLPRGGRILDLGCGRGLLLQALSDRGYEAHGVEMSETAAVGADPRCPIRVAPDLSQAAFPGDHFDAIIIWHVLEHLRDPRATLIEAHRILKPGGRLVVAVPNFSSWQARWSGSAWFHLDLPRHIHHFPAAGLKRLVSETGFDILSEHHFSLRQNPFGWVQSLLNKNRARRRNGLYLLLHNIPADSRENAEISSPGRLRLAYWLGMPLALAVSVVAAVFRSGATVHVDARARQG